MLADSPRGMGPPRGAGSLAVNGAPGNQRCGDEPAYRIADVEIMAGEVIGPQVALDRFAQVLLSIADEDPATLHDAPLTTPISRPDEVAAAKSPILKWRP